MRISDWSSDVCSSDLRRVRDDARSGADPRTPPVPDSGGDRGQGRRHGRLYRETRRRVEGAVSPIPLPLAGGGRGGCVRSPSVQYTGQAFPRPLTQASGGLTSKQIRTTHVCTPITNAHIVSRLMITIKKNTKKE